jgi:peptide/nickel transport system substrate-binding protein
MCAVAALVVSVACTASAPSSSSPPTAATSAPGAAAGTPSTTIVVGFPTDGSQNYDPHSAANQFVRTYLAPVFDTLVTMTPDGQVGPGLATAWEFGPNNETLTLHLREKVTFHDGTAFDAEAVKANITRGQTLPTSAVKNALAPITAIDVLDPKTVRLRLSGQAGALLAYLSDRAGMVLSPAAFTKDTFSTRPIGSGPWMVAADSVIGKSMFYDLNPNYWDPSVQGVKRIELRFLDATGNKNALLGGSINAALVTGPPADAETLRQAGLTVDSPPTQYLRMLYLNKSGPLANEQVRQAISMGIDREELRRTVFANTCTVDAQPFKPTSWAYDKDAAPPAYDAAKAKALLESAGASNLALTLVVSSASGVLGAEAQAIQGQLQKIGVNITIKPLAQAQLLQTFTSGQAETYYSAYPGGSDPAVVVADLTGALNPGGHADPQMTAAALRGASATSPAERAAAYRDWARRFQDTAFGVAICNQPQPVAYKKGVSGLVEQDPFFLDLRGVRVGS